MTDQAAYWNGAAGSRWVAEQALLDDMLQPFGVAAMRAASPRSGEVVLDVGSGCGDTTLALAALVGPTGRVLGVDISGPMLARAKERAAGMPHVTFRLGDASKEPFDPGAFDVLYSRFGVMFFEEPAAAFSHLRLALRPGGRLAFVCWRGLDENPWASAPFEAVARVLGRPEPSPPDAPGPFAFADARRVRSILQRAGLREVSMDPFDAVNVFAGADASEIARDLARLGPVARLLVDRSDDEVRRAFEALEAIVAHHLDPEGRVRFPAAAWIATAIRGGAG